MTTNHFKHISINNVALKIQPNTWFHEQKERSSCTMTTQLIPLLTTKDYVRGSSALKNTL